MNIRLDDLSGNEIRELLSEHIRCMSEASTPESRHVLDIDGLRQPHITFWSIWDATELMGCVALKEIDEQHGEIKSMRTVAKFLRKGVASRLLQHLIEEARKRGYRRISLETGAMEYCDAARKLYYKAGFRNCEPFDTYIADRNSVYMTMEL